LFSVKFLNFFPKLIRWLIQTRNNLKKAAFLQKSHLPTNDEMLESGTILDVCIIEFLSNIFFLES